ncbi:MAG: DNA-directed RNA polymerase subunit omega [Candidatus Omnitrophica bacterium]|nr:DNA-directed RNA polymerase subunit omega [Candidatus Omnitrophota bacterium]
MVPNIGLEVLYAKTGSIYKLVVMAAKRAIEINAAAAQTVQNPVDNAMGAALDEIAAGKLSFKKQKGKAQDAAQQK